MAFTPNDYVVVTLTEAGAAMLNASGAAMNEAFPKGGRWRTDWKAGEEYRNQFWCMAAKLEEGWHAGAAMPFSDMRLEPKP